MQTTRSIDVISFSACHFDTKPIPRLVLSSVIAVFCAYILGDIKFFTKDLTPGCEILYVIAKDDRVKIIIYIDVSTYLVFIVECFSASVAIYFFESFAYY